MSLIETPRARRQRLFNPPGGRVSSELEVIRNDIAVRERMRRHEAADRARKVQERASEREALLAQVWEVPSIVTTLPPELTEPLLVTFVTINSILVAASDYYKISLVDILSQRRPAPIVRARHVAMYLAHHLTKHSLPMIGRHFGGRDHTTVLHGSRKIEALLDSQPRLKDEIEDIKARLEVE